MTIGHNGDSLNRRKPFRLAPNRRKPIRLDLIAYQLNISGLHVDKNQFGEHNDVATVATVATLQLPRIA